MTSEPHEHLHEASPRLVHWVVPIGIVLAAVLYLVLQAMPTQDADEYDFGTFGAIPVSADGRVKPLDTVARTSLALLSGKQSFELDGRPQPAIRWLADVLARGEDAQHYKVFRIDHHDVQTLIGQHDPVGHYFSLTQIQPHWRNVVEQGQRAFDVPSRNRNAYQNAVLQLYRQVTTFMNLSTMQEPYMVPPVSEDDEWAPFMRVVQDAHATGVTHPAIEPITTMMEAYHEREPEAFNAAARRYRDAFVESMPPTARRASFEVFFNRFAPFYQATGLYVLAFLITGASLFMRNSRVSNRWAAETFGQAAFWLLVLTFVLHTFGLAARIYLQGRPPVTNLYSSAIFVGWGAVLLALILERIYRLGLGSLVAATIGFVTLIIAHNLAGDGDTMQMMQAVLDSNFWLATHVITITIGYSATFLAGLLGIVYIFMGVATRSLSPELHRSLSTMVYGMVCFALLFSFVGTVLGGIWADQSWGRFWGWDPKENGAALIVLMHAIILHARWGGMIKARGMMVLAVSGNIICAWAWFGTNLLGVGLHSYGFMDGAAHWLMAFVLSQLVIISVGLIPLEAWRSQPYRRPLAAIQASDDILPPPKSIDD